MGGPPRGVLVPGEHRGGPWRTDQDTADMLEEAARLAGTTWLVFQGSWHDGSLSGGTHSGAAVVDVWPKDGDAAKAVACLRQVGAFAWTRHPPRYEWHIHAGRVGAEGMDPTADQQAAWYLRGLNGLWPPSQAPDDGPRTHAGVTWARYKEEQDMPLTPDDIEKISTEAVFPLPGADWQTNPKRWALATYLRATFDQAAAARRDAAAALGIVKAMAARGRPLTSDETEAAVRAALADVVVNVDIDVTGQAAS